MTEHDESKPSKREHYPGRLTWVDREYDPHFQEKKRFRHLKSFGLWLRDHVMAGVIVGVLVAVASTLIVSHLKSDPSARDQSEENRE